MICLPPQGTPPHTHTHSSPSGSPDDGMLTPIGYTPPNTAADMAHSTHSTQPALRQSNTALSPGQKPNPRRRADPTQTVYAHPFRRAQTQVDLVVSSSDLPLRGSLQRRVGAVSRFGRMSSVTVRMTTLVFGPVRLTEFLS